jgi:DNA-binding transcriptional MerR regulator
MNLIDKKYFSISEVSEITGAPLHKLRYLEKSKIGVEVFQIRGRRYYTASDIALINKILSQDNKSIQLNLFTSQVRNLDNKALSKLGYSKAQMLETYRAEDQSVFNIHKDPTTCATTQLPLEVEFRKNSNKNNRHSDSATLTRIDSLISKFVTLEASIRL